MTIHKAKGLEFDTVIVPGLGRQPRIDEPPLILFHEWRSAHGFECLLAPIDETRAEKTPLYAYLRDLEKRRTIWNAPGNSMWRPRAPGSGCICWAKSGSIPRPGCLARILVRCCSIFGAVDAGRTSKLPERRGSKYRRVTRNEKTAPAARVVAHARTARPGRLGRRGQTAPRIA